jgi:hypothetical protein
VNDDRVAATLLWALAIAIILGVAAMVGRLLT